MNRKWSRILLSLMVLSVALTASASKLAFASEVYPAPELDPALAILGLTFAGTGVALLMERIRRRR
jgi:hypothetical protein